MKRVSRRTFTSEELFPKRTGLECGYCGRTRPPGRSRWCSQECAEAVGLICSKDIQYAALWKRDHGVCKACGIDTVRLEAVLYHCPTSVRLAVLKDLGIYHAIRTRLWAMDHIRPIAMGGGARPGIRRHELMENLQTLCLLCHKGKTKDDRVRIKAWQACAPSDKITGGPTTPKPKEAAQWSASNSKQRRS